MSSTLAIDSPKYESPSPWIVSAWWDLTYVVVTPVAIVPIVLILASRWLTAEEISLAVIAFASLGHHLPGFMRAYGDRDLFLRFRWRFILVPPLVFGLALLFSPPRALADALSIPWIHLHGLELILLIWGTWHGLMQTYGFMRIYDVRLGENDRWSARLDHWLCLVVFVAGVVFSDARVFAIANGMWQSGLPLFGPEVLYAVRALVGAIGATIAALYAINLFNRYKSGQPIAWLKIWLVGITGWFYWYTGRLSTNVLIGLAMFEIYHAVQYYAIVWIYNRRLMQRAGDRFGPLGFLFRDSRTMLGIYLAAIAAYSSIRLLNVDANQYVYRGTSQDAHQWLMALFVTSSFLHFYFDGFIWKVSERKTQENLVDRVADGLPLMHYVSGLAHLGKWAVLLAIAGGLLYSEWRQKDQWNTINATRVASLARLTPSLPECQYLLCEQALSQGDTESAIKYGRQALLLRPRSHSIHATLGAALAQAGRLPEAREMLENAVAIAPDRGDYHAELARVLARLGENELAEAHYSRAIEIEPESELTELYLVEFYLSLGRTADAKATLDSVAERFPSSTSVDLHRVFLLIQEGKVTEATRLATLLLAGDSDSWQANLALGSALNASGDYEQATIHLLKALAGNRDSTTIYYHLGLARYGSGDFAAAAQFFRKALLLDPAHFSASLQLGNSYFVMSKPLPALQAYQTALELRPDESALYGNVGGLLAQLGRWEEARETYLSGLEVDPDSAALLYNLGLLHLQQGETEQARERILRAKQLGVQVTPEVRAVLGEVPSKD